MPIESIAQVAVRGDAVAQRDVQIDAHIGESRVPEQAVTGAVRGLFVESLAAEVAVEVAGDAAAGEGRDDAAGVLGTAGQGLADNERARRDGQQPSFEKRVRSRDEYPARGT